nr:MAG TPA: hypothetical protein [Caudoviricetes sp.]
MRPKLYTLQQDRKKSTRLSHPIPKPKFQTFSNTPKISFPIK